VDADLELGQAGGRNNLKRACRAISFHHEQLEDIVVAYEVDAPIRFGAEQAVALIQLVVLLAAGLHFFPKKTHDSQDLAFLNGAVRPDLELNFTFFRVELQVGLLQQDVGLIGGRHRRALDLAEPRDWAAFRRVVLVLDHPSLD